MVTSTTPGTGSLAASVSCGGQLLAGAVSFRSDGEAVKAPGDLSLSDMALTKDYADLIETK